MGPRLPEKKAGGLPGKEKSKEQPNDVAFAVALAVAVPPVSLPEFTPHIALDFRTGGWSDSGIPGDSGTPVSAGVSGVLPEMESVAAASGPIPTGTESGTEAGGTVAWGSPFQEGAPGPTRAQGETAFEARIQLAASDVPDKPVPQTTAGQADGPAAADPAPGPPITTLLPHPSAAQAGNHKDAGNAEPVKPLQEHGVEPSHGKVPATDGTREDFGGREQQGSANPKKEPDETARAPLENSLRTAEPPISGATVSTAAPTSSSGGVTAPMSEPSVATVAQDAGADIVSAPRAGVPTRDIAIQLQNPGGPRVDVQLMDRAGTVHVVVRTQDDGLAKDLRTNLPDLALKLNQQGMEADAWSPVEMHNTSGGHENPGHTHEQTAGDSHSSAGGQDSGESRDGDQPKRQRPDPEGEFNRNFSGVFTGVTAWQPTR
ncbi:MAG: hypothetical protein ABSH47_02245 [Bryobacteraceae bacterium]